LQFSTEFPTFVDMPQNEPRDDQLELQDQVPTPRAPGRLRAAWRVLRGEALVHDQILAEWTEYQLIFGDMLKRFSALLAREAKAEKKRVQRLVAEKEKPEPPTQLELVPGADKSKLREIARSRGLGTPSKLNGRM
jgi:hypothetical protein